MRLTVRIPYVGEYEPRPGARRLRYRRAGRVITMKARPGDPVAEIELEARHIAAAHFGAPKPVISGSLADVVERYLASAYVPAAEATVASYKRAFAVLTAGSGADVRISSLTRPVILQLRDTVWLPAHGRWMANYCVTVLSVLFRYAMDTGIVVKNPLEGRVRKIPKAQNQHAANRPWAPEERRAVLSAAPWQIRLPIAIAMCAGLRKADIFRLTLADVNNGEIRIRTSKRGKPIRLPQHPLLVEAIAARPACDALQLCVTADGRPMSASGFDTGWQRLKTRLEADGKIDAGLTIHGLRHSLGHMLSEAGLRDSEIANVLAHFSVSTTRIYTDGAALPERTRNVITGLKFGE